jgi:carbon-monoxide dehydrogenase large subunit
MDARADALLFASHKFGVGQPVPRKEDPKLVRGEGRYTDDVKLPGQAYAVILRSRFAHGTLRGVDAAEALAMPGVLAVHTAADHAAAGIGPMPGGMSLPNRDGSAMKKPTQFALASDRVRYVGDPVAVVVAETLAQAKDAAEAVMVDIDPLPSVTDPAAAVAPDAPLLFEDRADNVALDWHFGDTAKVDEAFARAAHVTRLKLRNNRLVVSAMEPRAAVAQYDAASGRYTLHLGCQGAFPMRNGLADVLKVPQDKVRVLAGQIGGSFGMKAPVYPEYICVLHAARVLGRPVRWTDERSDSFLSDSHGRDAVMHVELALDKDGVFLAIRIEGFGNLGARLGQTVLLPPTVNTVKNIVGVYATPLVECSTRCTFSNTQPVGAYRGAGRPEGNYYMERLIDTAAAELGIDRVELRRRNHIRPETLPRKVASNLTYDSGEFPQLLDKALRQADWDGFEARRQESRARGKLRGRGIGQYLEVTAPSSKEMGGIRFEADGTVTIITGTLDYGQGHASPFAQVLSDRLGVPFEKIRLLQGDSDQLIAGGGTGGSRSMYSSGAAIVHASGKVIERGRQIAGHVFETAVEDVEFASGRFVVVGTDRAIGIMDLAERIRGGLKLPPELPRSLDVAEAIETPDSAFPNGCHIAEVEIDPETGVVEVVKYTMTNDFGVVINPLLVEGQAHGGVVQGIGQALMEDARFDENGQLLTASYLDYAIPRAADAPSFAVDYHSVPATTNPLGVKGCGEAGCAGALPSVMNAVVDALSEYGIRHIDMPATPQRVWQAIQEARRG